jgi:hypothetical protein
MESKNMSKIYTLNGFRPKPRNVNEPGLENQQEVLEGGPVHETDDVREAATAFVDGGLMDGDLWVTVDSITVRDDADQDANIDAFNGLAAIVQREKKERAEREQGENPTPADDGAISKRSI